MKVRQIQFNGVGSMEYVERELAPLAPDEVLVKVEACGLCTWERHIFSGEESMPFPFVGGHEIAATVLEKGKQVSSDIEIGMPAAIAKWKRCNACEPCRRGFDNHCGENFAPSDLPYSGPGGFADYLVCKYYEVFPFSKDMPVHYAALGEPVACVTRGISRMNVVVGDTVVVIGAGFMGLLFLKLLKLRGCKVIVVQRSEKRRENAKAAGADIVIDPSTGDWSEHVLELTGKLGAAAVVYTAGGSKVINDCMRAARVGATLLLYAPTLEESANIDIDQIHFKELVVTGALRHDKESFRQAVRLLGSGLLNYGGINLSFGSFERFEEEMRRADADRDIHRILLKW